MQAAEARPAPSIFPTKIFPTAETEEHLIWEFLPLSFDFLWMRWELKVSGLC